MTVYADVLVAVNLYLDYFLLICVQKTLGLHPGRWRTVLGAGAGGVSSLLALIPVPRWASLLFGFAAALAAVAAAYVPVRPVLFLRAAACYWIFSFLLAGFFLFLLTFFPTRGLAVLGNAVYFNISPLFLLLATCGACFLLRAGRRLLPRAGSLCCFEVTVEYGGERRTLFCRADTGCDLKEPFSGLPVLVAERDAMGGLFPGDADLDPEAAGKGFRLVPFHALGGSGVLPASLPERVFLPKTGTSLTCYVALYSGRLSSGQYSALLNPRSFPDTSCFSDCGGGL